jgi:hypothetical protein
MFAESQPSDVMGADTRRPVTWWQEIGRRGLACDITVALLNSITASNPAEAVDGSARNQGLTLGP